MMANSATPPHKPSAEQSPLSEAGCARLLQRLSMLVFELTPEGVTVYVNEAVNAITGYAPAEVLGHNWWDLFCPGEGRRQVAPLLDRLKTGDVSQYEVALTVRGGELVWLEVDTANDYDPAGKLISVVGVGKDCTRRRQAEAALAQLSTDPDDQVRERTAQLRAAVIELEKQIREHQRVYAAWRESEELCHQILSNISEAVFLTDDHGNFTFVCPNTHLTFGWLASEVMAMGNLRLLIGNDPPALGELEEELRNVEWCILNKSGQQRNLLVTIRRVQIGRATRLYACRDITERMRAEEALRESEGRYRSIFENSQDAILLTAPDGSIIDINPMTCQMFGKTAEEIQQMGRNGLVDASDPRLSAALEERARTGKARAEITMIRADGTKFPVDIVSTVFIDARGQQRTSMIIRDITTRKQAEEALYRTSHLLQVILDHIPQRIFWKDRALNYLGCNRACAHDFGLGEPAEIIGKSDFELALKENALRYRADDQEVMEAGVAKLDYEESAKLPDGRRIWGRTNKIPLRDPNGAIFGILGTTENITTRKEAEAALRESEERWRSLVSASPDYIALHDQEGKYLFLNHYAEGFTEQEVIGSSLYRYISPDSAEMFRKNMEAALATWTTQRFEFTGLGDNATLRTYEQYLVPMTSRNKEITILAVARDITARKQAEAKILQQNLQLSRSNALILALSKVSGELRISLTPHLVVQILCDELKRMKISCLLALRDSEDQSFVIQYGALEASAQDRFRALTGGEVQGMRLSRERMALFPQLIEQKQAHFISDPLAVAAKLFPDSPIEILEQGLASSGFSKTTGAVAIPLVAEDQMQGFFVIWDDDLQKEDLPIFSVFANQVAISLENARLFEQVRDGRERLQTLSHQLVESQEKERQQIARELHDEIGQILTGLALLLEMHPQSLTEEQRASLAEAKSLVNDLMNRLREISLDLRPAMLDDLGLLPALLWHFDRFTAQTGVAVRFKQNGLVEARFPSDFELAAYRIVQEALTNVARHAGVKSAEVRVWTDPQGLHLKIEDRGIGFESQLQLTALGALGIAGMHERVLLCGGTLNLDSSPGKGTRVYAILPLHERLERRRDEGLYRAGG
jgi:PAS domain S-box-containing protein